MGRGGRAIGDHGDGGENTGGWHGFGRLRVVGSGTDDVRSGVVNDRDTCDS